MTESSVASLSFVCLLLLLVPAQHAAASSHASYKQGFRKIFTKTPASRSSGHSKQASAGTRATTNTLCKTGAGLGNNKLLPVVHQQSRRLTASDVLRRDNSRIRRRFSSLSSMAAAAPAPSPAATTIPANSSSDPKPPREMDYSVLVSYGTPEQQFPVLLDNSFGTSLLRCKPCASGSDDCDLAFDPSRSSTFAHVLCGSPYCPTNCSSGSVCPFNLYYAMVGTFAEDVLTLAPTMAIHNFSFVCLDDDEPYHDELEAGGILDLSRDRNSLPSRLGGASPAIFSYCLPQAPSSRGFLSLGGDGTLPKDDFNLNAQAPLVSRAEPELSSMYFIDLVGISLGGEDLPIPAGTFGGNTSANMDVGTTFTMLAPDAYAVLRDAFRKEMSQYNRSVPGFAGFDTCFNFTGIEDLDVPFVGFKFSNGESLVIEDQMMYYMDPTTGPWGMTCLAFTSLDADNDVLSAVIGTYTLGSTEVVYDVVGGKIGFAPYCC